MKHPRTVLAKVLSLGIIKSSAVRSPFRFAFLQVRGHEIENEAMETLLRKHLPRMPTQTKMSWEAQRTLRK